MNFLEIRQKFEESFQIPFKAEKHSDTSFEIGPSINGGYLFRLVVAYSTKVRFSIRFQAEPFGLSVIKSMAGSSLNQRVVSSSYFSILENHSCAISICFDGTKSDATNPSLWPASWSSMTLTVTKKLITPFPDKTHIETALPFTLMAMAALLALLPMEETDLPKQEELQQLPDPETEGSKYQVTLNRYERSRLNRSLCLFVHGHKCAVCGLDFEEQYGDLGKDYIQVHHVVPVSQLGPDYKINPSEDLIPVCPNCHAMLHRRNPPLTVEELKEILERRKK